VGDGAVMAADGEATVAEGLTGIGVGRTRV